MNGRALPAGDEVQGAERAVRIWLPKPLDPEGRNGSYTPVGRVVSGLDVRHLDAYLRRLTAMLGERC